MTNPYHVVVCASVVPDPLQTLEPINGPTGPALKNEMMLPAILDPWASHALYEGANLVKHVTGSKLWLVSMAPKAKLQQVMMTVAQKVPLQLVAVDGPSSGFADAHQTAHALAAAIRRHRRHRSVATALVWRMGIRQPQRRRDFAAHRRGTRHC